MELRRARSRVVPRGLAPPQRAVLAGETVLDSRRTKVLHETGRLPVHYFPLDDIRPDVLVDTTEESTYDRTGSMRHLDLRVGDRVAAGAVTAHLDPPAGAPPLAGYATVEFSAVDRWFEEDDPIYSHPRDPFHRVDVRASSVHGVARYDGTVVADSTRPKLLFETAKTGRLLGLPWSRP